MYVKSYILTYVKMLPKIVSPTELRKNLAKHLEMSENQIIIIKGKNKNRVIIDEDKYNRLEALASQFLFEDPEGKYHPKFVKEVLNTSQKNEVDESIKSLRDLINEN